MTDRQLWPLIHTLLVQFAPRIAEAEAADTYEARIAIINGVSAHIAGKVEAALEARPSREGDLRAASAAIQKSL